MAGNVTKPLNSNSTYHIMKLLVGTEGRHTTPKYGTAEMYFVNFKIKD